MILIAFCLIFTSLSLGMMGPLVLWNKLENIGDALSHSIMLSLVVHFIIPIGHFASSIIVTILFALMVDFIKRDKNTDNSARIISISCLFVSSSILAADFSAGKIRLKEFMLGDIFSVTMTDLYISAIILLSVIVFLYYYLDEIILSAISEESAAIKGIKVGKLQLITKLLLFLSITISANIAGVLLITALITMPASIARYVSYSPRQMVFFSSGISVIFSSISLIISLLYDVAYAPCLAFMMAFSYLSINLLTRLRYN